MKSLFGASPTIDVEIALDNEQEREHVDIKVQKDRRQRYPLYLDGEAVSGKIIVRIRDGKPIQHEGIKVNFIGNIETTKPRNASYPFLSLSQELASPGNLTQKQTTFDFKFENVEKQFECFRGFNVRLRYFVSLTISRKYSDIIRERDLWVYSYPELPLEIKHKPKMEVGIENCLHIEFEYSKDKYHLKDVIVGRISFHLIRLEITKMELSIVRQETSGLLPNQYNVSENIAKYEIMDGEPMKGETIPIRLFLGGFELGPTFSDINLKFSVKYYLNLVLVDKDNRRYFKQQEITMYRKKTTMTRQ